MSVTINLWYAVNGSGQGRVFVTQPVRDERRRIWVGGINLAALRFIDFLETDCSFPLPDITWKDESVQISISASHEQEEQIFR